MKRVPLFALPAVVALGVLGASSALAQAPQRQVIRPPGSAQPATVAAPTDAGAAAADGGVREKGKEGAEQKKRRKDYVERIRKEIRAIVPAHSLTDADRDLVRVHWRRAMRTLRVKLIAEDSNDNATIARCDALLAKMDQQLFDKLKELHKKGAAAPAKDGGK